MAAGIGVRRTVEPASPLVESLRPEKLRDSTSVDGREPFYYDLESPCY